MDYNKLNTILKYYKEEFENLKRSYHLVQLYIDTIKPFSLTPFSLSFSKEECFTETYEFLSDLDYKYGKAFYLFMNEIIIMKNKNKVCFDGKIFVDLLERNNMKNLMTLIHESTHKIFFGTKSIQKFFTEWPSILNEFQFVRYCSENKEPFQEDAYRYLEKRINTTLIAAYKIIYEFELLNLYMARPLKKGDFQKLKKKFQNNKFFSFQKYFNEIIQEQSFLSSLCIRYVIGVLLTSYTMTQKNNLKCKYHMEFIRDHTAESEYNTLFSTLDIPNLYKEDIINYPNTIQEFKKSLEQVQTSISKRELLSLTKKEKRNL